MKLNAGFGVPEFQESLESAASQRAFDEDQLRHLLAIPQGIGCPDSSTPIVADHLNPLMTHGDSELMDVFGHRGQVVTIRRHLRQSHTSQVRDHDCVAFCERRRDFPPDPLTHSSLAHFQRVTQFSLIFHRSVRKAFVRGC